MSLSTLTILPPKAVWTKINSSRSGMYNKMNPKHSGYDATFPTPLKLGQRRIGFLEHEIDAWIESRKRARDHHLAKPATEMQ